MALEDRIYWLLLFLVVSFFIAVFLLPFLIRWLNREKVDQTERKELASHQKKTGTPTMGGIAIITAFTVTCLIAAHWFPAVIPVIVLTLGFGLIGLLDDALKVVKHSKDGLIAWQKLLLQFVVTTLFIVFLRAHSGIALTLRIPFSGGHFLDIGWVAYPLLYFAVLGTVNGTNFTDGIDGLLSTVTLPVALFFTGASVYLAVTEKAADVAPAGIAMTGALLAFLCFNAYPAKVFMGDTGSLAIGGFVAGMAYMLQMPLYILIVGFIYLLEVVSVILQVGYFKATHGKRLFRMAPIHHHFELGGWSETRVVAVFSAVTALLAAAAVAGI